MYDDYSLLTAVGQYAINCRITMAFETIVIQQSIALFMPLNYKSLFFFYPVQSRISISGEEKEETTTIAAAELLTHFLREPPATKTTDCS